MVIYVMYQASQGQVDLFVQAVRPHLEQTLFPVQQVTIGRPGNLFYF